MSRPINTESVFRAIAHPTRRRMLELIARREWAACDLEGQFGHHSQPTLSKHLRVLEGTGLVRHARKGRNLIYSISPGAVADVSDWLRRLPGDAKSRLRVKA
jgi:DNA-binding transcriptional ArsR family regulator